MKIVHSTPPMCPAYGGPFSVVLGLSQAQLASGAEVEVRMPWSTSANEHRLDWQPVSVSIEGVTRFSSLAWSPVFARGLRNADADILHTHGIWHHPSWVALSWKRAKKGGHVSSVHGSLEPWAWAHRAWKKRPVWWAIENRNLRSADLLHATCEREAETLRSHGLTAPIAVIPNGVDVRLVAKDPRLNRGRNARRTALFLGRLHPVKGLPLLLKAWAKVRPTGWRLRIVGPDEGGHRTELERLVGALGLRASVQIDGPVEGSQKTAAFLDSDLFILPSRSENFGVAVAEALAHGLPVITTHGAPWRLLEIEGCGWWVPIGEGHIAAALEDATRKDPGELHEMGMRGRRVVAERFAWDRVAKDFSECYGWVLGKGSAPSCVI
jgi:glycosyltransferase involved in cell wall biosynthesis